MKDIKYIIIGWILSFLIYGIARLINKRHMKKYNEKSMEKGPSKTKEKINA